MLNQYFNHGETSVKQLVNNRRYIYLRKAIQMFIFEAASVQKAARHAYEPIVRLFLFTNKQ